jgi:hypothetical protein
MTTKKSELHKNIQTLTKLLKKAQEQNLQVQNIYSEHRNQTKHQDQNAKGKNRTNKNIAANDLTLNLKKTSRAILLDDLDNFTIDIDTDNNEFEPPHPLNNILNFDEHQLKPITQRISIYLYPTQIKKLDIIAHRCRRSRSGVIRAVIENLANNKLIF